MKAFVSLSLRRLDTVITQSIFQIDSLLFFVFRSCERTADMEIELVRSQLAPEGLWSFLADSGLCVEEPSSCVMTEERESTRWRSGALQGERPVGAGA